MRFAGSAIRDGLTNVSWRASSTRFSSLQQRKHCPGVKLSHFRHCNVHFKSFASYSRNQDSVERDDAAITGPLVGPHPALTAEDSVNVQLNALCRNNEPRRDHGIEVMYHFANAEGTLEGGALPCYFGFPADLYHYGHFSLKFKTRFKELPCLKTFQIIEQKIDISGQTPTARIQVQVTPDAGWLSQGYHDRKRLDMVSLLWNDNMGILARAGILTSHGGLGL